MRAGLHAGEVELIGEDIGGIAVHVAARIAALGGAAPGARLAHRARPRRRLGGRVHSPPAAHALKGVPDEWDVYSVAAS